MQRYRVHVHVREMWLHDEENVEAAADAMKRPLSTLRSARRGTSLQLRVGDRLDDANGGVGGHQRPLEHGGQGDGLCLRAASGRSRYEAGDGLGDARGDHGAEEGVKRARADPWNRRPLTELYRPTTLRLRAGGSGGDWQCPHEADRRKAHHRRHGVARFLRSVVDAMTGVGSATAVLWPPCHPPRLDSSSRLRSRVAGY